MPSNCSSCWYKLHPDGGWCYMFREEPEGVCMKHRQLDTTDDLDFQDSMSLDSPTDFDEYEMNPDDCAPDGPEDQ